MLQARPPKGEEVRPCSQEVCPAKRRDTSHFASQFSIAIGLIPIIFFPWILSGFFDSSFLVFSIAATEIAALLGFLLYHFFGLTPRQVSMRSYLSMAEIALKHPVLIGVSLSLFGLLIFGGYLSAATYIYFAHPLHSEESVQQIFILTLVLFLAGALFTIVLFVFNISSPQVDDRTRRALFFSLLISALPMGVFLTVFLWMIGIAREKSVLDIFGLTIDYLYVPTIGLTVFFLFIMVLPYIFGLQGRRSHEIAIYRKIVDCIRKIIDIVEIPSEKDISQLSELRDEINREIDDFVGSEPIVSAGVQIELAGSSTEQLEEQLRALVEPYHALKTEDLRFVYLSSMQSIHKVIEEMITEYTRAVSDENRLQKFVSLATAYGNHFRNERQDYERKIREAEERKIIAPVLRTIVTVLGSAPTVVQYGRALIKILPFGH